MLEISQRFHPASSTFLRFDPTDIGTIKPEFNSNSNMCTFKSVSSRQRPSVRHTSNCPQITLSKRTKSHNKIIFKTEQRRYVNVTYSVFLASTSTAPEIAFSDCKQNVQSLSFSTKPRIWIGSPYFSKPLNGCRFQEWRNRLRYSVISIFITIEAQKHKIRNAKWFGCFRYAFHGTKVHKPREAGNIQGRKVADYLFIHKLLLHYITKQLPLESCSYILKTIDMQARRGTLESFMFIVRLHFV